MLINLKFFVCNKYIFGLFKNIFLELFFSINNRLKLIILCHNSIIQYYLCLHHFFIIMLLNLNFNLANNYHFFLLNNSSIQLFMHSFCHSLFLYYCKILFSDFMKMHINNCVFHKSCYINLILKIDHIIFVHLFL